MPTFTANKAFINSGTLSEFPGQRLELSPAVLLYKDLSVNLFRETKRIKSENAQDMQILSSLSEGTSLPELEKQTNLKTEVLLDHLLSLETEAPGTIQFPESPNYQAYLNHGKRALELLGEHQASLPTPCPFDFHHSGISDSLEQFEQRETTVSHLFREAETPLQNRTFGRALIELLVNAHGSLEQSPMSGSKEIRILEIGGGVGFVSREVLTFFESELPELYENLTYTIVDLSPELQRSQGKLNGEHPNLQLRNENILKTDLDEGSFDLIISNEMIADLPVENIALGTVRNTGAIELTGKIALWLKKKGVAWISEYGTFNDPPRRLSLKGHDEHSIRFSDLIDKAHSAGLATHYGSNEIQWRC